MKYSTILLGLLIPFLTSCDSKNEIILFPDSTTFNLEDVEHFHLSGGRHLEMSPVLRVVELAFFDSLLILSGQSTANDFIIHIYSPINGRHINSFAPLGRGPNEFTGAGHLQVLTERRELYTTDANLNLGVTYSLDSLLSESITPTEIIRFNDFAYTMYLRLDSTIYLCGPTTHSFRGLEPSYVRYWLYDAQRDSLYNRVSLPPLDGIDSIFNRRHISSIFITESLWLGYNEVRGKIVTPYYRTDLLEVYDYRNNLERTIRIHGPDRFFPDYVFRRPATSIAELRNTNIETWPVARDFMDQVYFLPGKSKTGYIRARAYEEGFYVVYNGNIIPADSDYSKDVRSIFYFSYDGTPLRRYTFDIPFMQHYIVDVERGIIYLLGLDGEIYAYDIP